MISMYFSKLDILLQSCLNKYIYISLEFQLRPTHQVLYQWGIVDLSTYVQLVHCLLVQHGCLRMRGCLEGPLEFNVQQDDLSLMNFTPILH